MLKQYTALSVVAPNAGRIVQGQKTLEVRSWHPEALPLKDVVIVENQNFLLQDGDEEAGLAVALVDIEPSMLGEWMKLKRLAHHIGLKAISLG